MMAKHRDHHHAPAPIDDSPVWRIERELGEMNLLGWIEAQPHALKIYWQSRDGEMEMVGVGAADKVTPEGFVGIKAAFDHMREQTRGSGARYFGGLCFDSARAPRDVAWLSFGDFMFVLPLVEVVRRGSRITLALNALRTRIEEDGAEAALSDLKSLREIDEVDVFGELSVGQRTDSPDAAEWRRMVDRSLSSIAEGRLEKAVLARRTEYGTTAPVSPWGLLHRLRQNSSGRYLFGFQPDGGAAFIGASPERLYRRRDHVIESEALAGTRPVSDLPGETRQLTDELLASDKERREHQFVVDHLTAAMKSLCTDYRVDSQPEAVKYGDVQHLRTDLSGELGDHIDDAAILRTLHPTPAVGGTPRPAALEYLREVEPFDRGWYAGPLGWIDSTGAEFAVAIRSALVRPDGLSLYAGAGIVVGSDAAREWDELENKIAPMARLLK